MKTTIKSAVAAALLCLAGIALAEDTIKIGAVLPRSGGSANMGLSAADGQRLAVKEINAKGGVLGKKLELIEIDDEANPGKARQNMQSALAKGIVACSCGVNTGVVQTYQPDLQAAKIPNVIPASAGSKLTKLYKDAPEGNYTFRVQANDTLQAEIMVDTAIKRGLKKIALLSDSTPYGVGGEGDMLKQLEKRGIKPVAVERFNLKDSDMSAQLLKAKDAGAQVLLVYGIGPEQAQIALGNQKLGMNLPMIGSWPAAMDSFLSIAGTASEGVMSVQTFVEGAKSEGGQAFESAYHHEYKRARIVNPTAAAGGYDSIYLIAKAMTQAGTTDGAKVKEALENLNGKHVGAVTVYNKPFNKDDHEAIKIGTPVVARWLKGAIVLAK